MVARYRFVLRPKWIFGHLLVLALVVAMVNLGFWQLRRLHQRKAFNNRILTNEAKPAAPLPGVLGPHATEDDATADQGRNVRATGHYDTAESIVVTGQSINNVPGVWVMTPLVLEDGRAVLVNRGFIADNGGLSAPPAGAEPPAGTVTVTGSIQPTETPSGLQHRDSVGASRRTNFTFVDIGRIQTQIRQQLLPGWLLATAQKPPYTGKVVLQPVTPPELSNGPHLSYAIQWFAFSAIGVFGYPLLLWRRAADEDQDMDVEMNDGDGSGPAGDDGPDGGGGGGQGRGGPPDQVPGDGPAAEPPSDREVALAATRS